TVTARRSPNARLYSALPRSSQWPSIVTAQVGFCFIVPAFSCSTACACSVISELSYSKNTGLSGELLFRSSSEADRTLGSRTGSGGTVTGSRTGSGGSGGRVMVDGTPAAAPVGAGGGFTFATGGGFRPQATTTTDVTRTMISEFLISLPWVRATS